MKQLFYFYLTLLRHGETIENKKQIIQGHLNTNLSPHGIEQARTMKKYLSCLPFDVVFSSDLNRAKLTAYEVVDQNVVEEDGRLRERNFGSYCGKLRTEVMKFSESNNTSEGGGCEGWRNVGGECAHEVAKRTHEFLMELCVRLANRSRIDEANRCHLVTHSDHPPMSTFVWDLFKSDVYSPDNSKPIYGGHVLIVSHGGWLRQVLRLLTCHTVDHFNFPSNCCNGVMQNCGVAQIGLAFDLDLLLDYVKNPQVHVHGLKSPLPVFGNIMESSSDQDSLNVCPYINQANPCIPIKAVCYHYNLTASCLGDKESSGVINANDLNDKTPSFLIDHNNDDDEYAAMKILS